MSMKKVLALLLALALLVSAFAACSGGSGSSTEESASTPESSADESSDDAEEPSTGDNQEGNEPAVGDATALFTPRTDITDAQRLTIRVGMEPTGLNTITSTYADEFTAFRHLYDNLLNYDADGLPVAGAAETWDISEDQCTYTFHLRSDGKWTNGDPVTANDFAFAWKEVLNPDNAADYAYMLTDTLPILNAAEYYAGECEWEDVGIKVIDDATLELTLKQPTAYTLSLLTFGTFCPINERFYEAVGADKYNTEAEYFCTNGPFAMTEWVHQDHYTMQKNPDYYDADSIEVEEMVFRIIDDNTAAITSFLAGEIDITGVGSEELTQQVTGAGFETYDYSGGSAFYIYINHKDPYLSNVNLRRAFAYAMNKQEMIDTVYKNANKPMTSFTCPDVAGYDGKPFIEAVGEMYPAAGDKEKAVEYLETALTELGVTREDLNGKFAIDASQDTTALAMCAYYQEQWKQILGIEVGVNPMDTKQNSANRRDGNFTMSITGWGPDYNDPNTFLDLWITDGGNNQTGWSNAQYDELIQKAAAETDPATRQGYFVECEKIFADELPVLPNYFRGDRYTKDDKVVGGEVNSAFQTNYRWVDLKDVG